MKITALVPEELIQDVKKYSGGKNIIESIIIALNDYINRQRIKKSVQKLKKIHLNLSLNLALNKFANRTGSK